jgi:hypothetical protein
MGKAEIEKVEMKAGAARDQCPGSVVVPVRFSRMPFPLRCLRFLLFKFFGAISKKPSFSAKLFLCALCDSA